ncbi:MAG: RNA polymerase sigma factor [Melioribacteraceae bacterium]|nr:RNA polymerase sigma factor [Melioribacteraceae bacterium]
MDSELENRLVAKCKEKDGNAFRLLCRDYQKSLSTYLFRMCWNEEITKDLLQETLIKAWKGIGKYNHQSKFSSWLFSIAHNVAIDFLRKNKKSIEVTERINIDGVSSGNSGLYEIENSELHERINSAIISLSDKQREVFLIRQHSGMTFKEIAAQMNEPLNTVLSHMNYAVKKLKKELRDIYVG